MADALDGARAKLARARTHVQALDLAMDEFMTQQKPHRVVKELDAGGRELVCKSRVEQSPPLHWSLLIGDALQNVRAALDYLACELTILNLGPEADLRHCAYPIFVEPAPEAAWRRRIGGLDEAQRAVLEKLQPYAALDGQPHLHPLWLLHELARVDKHRAIHVTYLSLRLISYPSDLLRLVNPPSLGPVHDGAEMARFRAVPGQRDVDVKIEFAIGISFDEAGPAEGLAVRSVLGAIHDTAANIVDAFRDVFANG